MNKNTIAFLTRSLIDATGREMWKGIVSACQKDRIPLITFRGPVLNKGQGSIIYHLLTDDSVAGIISWASSDVDKKTFDFYKKFQKTPLVCMTFKIEGKPLIITDCKAGELELIEHLITVHHFTKIAFIRGPETHIYAKERFEGYLEGLQKHGIQINEDLISPYGGWSINDGIKAVNGFIEKGLKIGQDIQAIVAVGDNVAIGAQEELIRKGYSIPHDIAVCGYNGTNDAAWSNPPITSVEMPFYGQGIQAYNTLQAIFNNKDFQQEFRYSSHLVLGESCGCTSVSVNNAYLTGTKEIGLTAKKKIIKSKALPVTVQNELLAQKLSSEEWTNLIIQKISELVNHERYASAETIEFFNSYAKTLISAFVKDSQEEERSDTFLQAVSVGLNRFEKISKEFSVWQDILSILRAESLSDSNFQTPISAKCENLLQQARVLLNEFDGRTQKQTNLLETRQEATLRQISTDILSCSELDKLFEIITSAMPKIGMSGCYLVLYNNCTYTEENHELPQTSRLMLAVRRGEKIRLPEGGLTFKTHEIIPDTINNSADFAIYEVESLHYQNSYLGYIVFESTKDNGVAFSTLRDQISCSIYSALLLEERNKSRNLLETTMQTMSEKADVVSNQSESVNNNISTISSSMENFAESIKNISGNVANVASTVESANQMINEADSSLKSLVQITEQITHAVELINDIAEKTNVLALNAAIEAAHAGDAGRGFSVVAKEVKALAAQTVSSTAKIQELVQKNNLSTKQAEEVISSTNKAIKNIANLSERIKTSINEQVQSSTAISNRLQEASGSVEQITSAITEVAKLGLQLKI